jgi:phosphatidate phosphatase APP1
MTRKLELEAGGDPVLDQIRYKTQKIESILPRFAGVKFVLVDDGEHDPETYSGIQNNPELRAQVRDVWIHKVNTDPGRPTHPDQGDLNTALAGTK